LLAEDSVTSIKCSIQLLEIFHVKRKKLKDHLNIQELKKFVEGTKLLLQSGIKISDDSLKLVLGKLD